MGRSYAALLANAAPLDDGQPIASTSTASIPRNTKHDVPPSDEVVFEAFLPLAPELDESINLSTLMRLAGNEVATMERDTMPLDLCPTTPPAAQGEEEEEPQISPSPSSGVFHTRTLDLPLELPANRRTPSPRPSTSTAARSSALDSTLDARFLLNTAHRSTSNTTRPIEVHRREVSYLTQALQEADTSSSSDGSSVHIDAMLGAIASRRRSRRSDSRAGLREAQDNVELELERTQGILAMLQTLRSRQQARREERGRSEQESGQWSVFG